MAAKKHTVKFIQFDDWAALVVDGKLVEENHKIRANHALEKVAGLGRFEFAYEYPEYDSSTTDMDEDEWVESILAEYR